MSGGGSASLPYWECAVAGKRASAARRPRADDEDRLAALGTLAAGMSHEILNPVNTISLACQYLEALLTRQGPVVEGVVREHFRLIHLELGRIRKILDDCSKFRRVLMVRQEPLDFGAFLRRMVEAPDWASPRAGVVCSVEGLAGADGLTVALDPDSFRQAMGHLLRNAVESMPDGGTIAVSALRHGRHAHVELADGGCGIAPEQLGKVFEPYFTTKPDSVGIGLTLVRTIVRAHHGTVALRSRPGKGTTVAIRLPLVGQRPAPRVKR